MKFPRLLKIRIIALLKNKIMNDDKKNKNERVQLSLYGMHCASCAALIERSLKKTPGVKQANVNFAAEKASVVFDTEKTDTNALIDAVAGAGYRAETVNAKDTE